jgi:hypothetical protein
VSEEKPEKLFLIPSPTLGRTEDVYPELVTQSANEWVELSRHILKQKRNAQAKGQWRPDYSISEESNRALHPFGAQYCPALLEAHDLGYVLKWPATAIVRKAAPKGWQLKPSTNFNFYKYHEMTSFVESGEAEAISVDTGWSIIAPPGWSVLVKAIPNNLSGLPGGVQFAEGIIRVDQAVVGLQVHAKIPENAPKEFKIKRGDPMLLLFPFKRDVLELAVMEDKDSVDEAERLITQHHKMFELSPGTYRQLYMEDFNPTPFYDRLCKNWQESQASMPAEDATDEQSSEPSDGEDSSE